MHRLLSMRVGASQPDCIGPDLAISLKGGLVWDGLPDRDRTCDPQLRRLLLYPTELRAEETQKALDGPLFLK